LKDVIFFLENIDASIADYRKKTVFQKVTAVTEIDKKDLKDYLMGVTDTCPQLDFSVAATLTAAPVTASASAAAAPVAQEVITPAVPQISAEELEQQRQRHAALFEQSLQAVAQPMRYTSPSLALPPPLFNCNF
jgi:Paf1 complex subunit CDC73 N-terminal